MGWYVVAAKVAMQLVNGASQAKQESLNNIAQNKMIMEYNKKVQYETLQQVTQINLQRAQTRQDTTAAIFNAQNQGMSARDQIVTQAAATDTIGASVNDAIATVNQKQGQAVGSAQDQFKRAIDQSNLMVTKATEQGLNSLKDPTKDNSTQIMNQAGWGAVGSVLGKLAGDATGGSKDTPAPISQASTSDTPIGSFDYQGANSDPLAGNNPFGLSFGFSTNSSLSGN